MPAPPRPTLPSPSVGLRSGVWSWRLCLGVLVALVLFTMLVPLVAWVFVWLAQLLGPFNSWYQGLFPRWAI